VRGPWGLDHFGEGPWRRPSARLTLKGENLMSSWTSGALNCFPSSRLMFTMVFLMFIARPELASPPKDLIFCPNATAEAVSRLDSCAMRARRISNPLETLVIPIAWREFRRRDGSRKCPPGAPPHRHAGPVSMKVAFKLTFTRGSPPCSSEHRHRASARARHKSTHCPHRTRLPTWRLFSCDVDPNERRTMAAERGVVRHTKGGAGRPWRLARGPPAGGLQVDSVVGWKEMALAKRRHDADPACGRHLGVLRTPLRPLSRAIEEPPLATGPPSTFLLAPCDTYPNAR